VAELTGDTEPPQVDETARQRVALLTGKAALDAREAKYRQLVVLYGGNRRAKRRARAEVRKRGTAG
jgi:hypothetical protein